MLRRPLRLAALVATAVSLATAASASAQVRIGEVAAPAAATPFCVRGPYDNVPSGPTASLYGVPSAGVITSWSNQSTEGTGQELTFKVFRPVGAGPAYPQFQVVGQDGPRSLVPSALNTFPVEIPVKAGDVIGDNDVNAGTVHNACLFRTANAADVTYFLEGSLLLGELFEGAGLEPKSQMNIAATLLMAPTISAVTPGTGPAAGGTAITIAGSEFADVKGVTVGSVPVPFTVLSETTITAATTAGVAGSPTPVTVSTIAGNATGSFTYEATCKVPKLIGRKLKPAKDALRKADCRPGTVTRAKGVGAKAGKVVKQNPRKGSSRRAGAKVSLRLG